MTSRFFSMPIALVILAAGFGSATYAGTATNVTGLYYTGINNGGGLLSGGAQDSHWSVSYADVNGNTTVDNGYEGAARVVSGTYIDAGWTQNTATAQWIVPPGAMTAGSGGTVDVGGDYLPGNGSSGVNMGIYVYTLAFNIVGTGSGTVTNSVSISLTLSADDQYQVYINNAAGLGNLPTGTAAGSGLSAWNNTASVTLQNGTTGFNGNAQFVIGTNYLSVRVDNTNSVSGSSTATALNPSGLLVYQVGSATLINGVPIPEVGAWLPLVSALGIYGVWVWNRQRQRTLVRVSV
jgi:hypothetical protein